MSSHPQEKTHNVKRTFVLAVLVLLCVVYIFRAKYMTPLSGLDAAKEKIAHIRQQPATGANPERKQFAYAATRRASLYATPKPEGTQEAGAPTGLPTGDEEKITRLVKGTFTVVDGEIVYGQDAQLDIGHGMLVSSPTGVMVSDVDQRHIAGDLVIDSQYGTTTTENAFLSVDKAHVEITSDNTVTVKKDEPK
jgi:hypothetical protein